MNAGHTTGVFYLHSEAHMPYSMDDTDKLPEAVQKLPAKDQRKWVAVWNSAYSKCEDEGGEDCEGSAFAQANGVVMKEDRKRSTIGEIIGDAVRRFWYGRDHVAALVEDDCENCKPTKRALSMGQIMDRVIETLRINTTFSPYAMPLDLYHEGEEMFLLVNDEGKLYRLGVSLDEDDNAILSEPTEVTVTFRPVNQRAVAVTRQADGRYRFMITAASAVLNRVGEIDSTELFDSFIENSKTRGMPILTFWHMSRAIHLGVADYLARDGYLYLASGLFDDTPEGNAAAESLARDSSGWGSSIGYYPDAEPGFVEVIRGIKLPVYNSGWNEEISLLPEEHAASWFTAVSAAGKEIRMQKEIKQALVTLLGPALADEKEREIDAANATVRENRMIARDNAQGAAQVDATRSGTEATEEAMAVMSAVAESQTPTVSADAQAEAQATEPAAVAPAIDGDAIARSVSATIQAQMDERFEAMNRSLAATTAALNQLLQVVDDVATTTADVSTRVTAMEAAEQAAAQEEATQRANDMPAANQLYRPRMSRPAPRQNGQPQARDMASVASGTLSNLKIPAPKGGK